MTEKFLKKFKTEAEAKKIQKWSRGKKS